MHSVDQSLNVITRRRSVLNCFLWQVGISQFFDGLLQQVTTRTAVRRTNIRYCFACSMLRTERILRKIISENVVLPQLQELDFRHVLCVRVLSGVELGVCCF